MNTHRAFEKEHEDTRTRQGWCLSEVSCEGGCPWQIQKLDEVEVFQTDEEAWDFVAANYAYGCTTAAVSIEFLKEVNLCEYKLFSKTTGLSELGVNALCLTTT